MRPLRWAQSCGPFSRAGVLHYHRRRTDALFHHSAALSSNREGGPTEEEVWWEVCASVFPALSWRKTRREIKEIC
jgi:hypothetical protein